MEVVDVAGTDDEVVALVDEVGMIEEDVFGAEVLVEAESEVVVVSACDSQRTALAKNEAMCSRVTKSPGQKRPGPHPLVIPVAANALMSVWNTDESS